jgi:parvulin-like peptidyl-prolyl isomerase
VAGVFALIAFVLLTGGCKPKAKTTAPGVLAKVGSHEIRVEDFKREMEWRIKNQRPLPDKQSLLDEMIARELLLQKARAAGLEDDPDIRHSYESLLAGKLREHLLTPRIDALKVSPEEVQALYEKNLSQNTRSAKAHLALIYIKTERKMTPERLAEVEKRIEEARQLALALPAGTRGFGRVAIDYSEDQASRYKGGDAGWFDQGQTAFRWPAEVVSAGFALKTNGEISQVIKATNGLYLVSKLDTRDAVTAPLEQVQASLQRRLLTERRQQTEATFRQELRAAAPVESFPQALGQVEYPTTVVAKSEEPLPPSLPTSH